MSKVTCLGLNETEHLKGLGDGLIKELLDQNGSNKEKKDKNGSN